MWIKQMLRITPLSLLLAFAAVTSYGQDEVNRVGSHQFVIVIKGNGSNNAKVLMEDGNASSFDFNPEEISTYPVWRLKRVKFNTSIDFFWFKCMKNNMYFAFGKPGDDKMISGEEYQELMYAKDKEGNLKHGWEDKLFFNYQLSIDKDDKHINLNYVPGTDPLGKTSIVRMKTWESNSLKLVLVN